MRQSFQYQDIAGCSHPTLMQLGGIERKLKLFLVDRHMRLIFNKIAIFLLLFSSNFYLLLGAAEDDDSLGRTAVALRKIFYKNKKAVVLSKLPQPKDGILPEDLFQELTIAKLASDHGFGPKLYAIVIEYEDKYIKKDGKFFAKEKKSVKIDFDDSQEKIKKFLNFDHLKSLEDPDWGTLLKNKFMEIAPFQLKNSTKHRKFKMFHFYFKAAHDVDSVFATEILEEASQHPKSFWLFAKKLIAKIKLMHQHRLIHGDIKIDNIIFFSSLTEDGDYKLYPCDFGSSGSKAYVNHDSIKRRKYSTIYPPNEREFDPIKKDIWAIGITLLLVLCEGCDLTIATKLMNCDIYEGRELPNEEIFHSTIDRAMPKTSSSIKNFIKRFLRFNYKNIISLDDASFLVEDELLRFEAAE